MNSISTSPARAPSAMRTPISCVRLVTPCAVVAYRPTTASTSAIAASRLNQVPSSRCGYAVRAIAASSGSMPNNGTPASIVRSVSRKVATDADEFAPRAITVTVDGGSACQGTYTIGRSAAPRARAGIVCATPTMVSAGDASSAALSPRRILLPIGSPSGKKADAKC